MKFKVDEDLPGEVAKLLRDAGHDAHTVHDEKLTGQSDERIASVAGSEETPIVRAIFS